MKTPTKSKQSKPLAKGITSNGIEYVIDAPLDFVESRFVFGNKNQQWFLVDKHDRDFATGIPRKVFTTQPEALSRAQYLNPSIL